MRVTWMLALVAVVAGLAVRPLPVQAQQAVAAPGQVVAVIADVRRDRGGQVSRIAEGDDIAEGDVLRSGPGASAQIAFSEGTRIAIGPNSVLRIDAVLLRRDGKARDFTVSAIGGAFRFLSGDSPHRAYAIRTPSATMGIRGTAFDVAVGGADTTGLLVFEGRVRFCDAGRLCSQVPGGCTLVSASTGAGFSQPGDVAEKLGDIAARFPFVAADDRLLPQFRTGRAGCDEPNVRVVGLTSSTVVRDGDGPNDQAGGGPERSPDPPDFNPAE